MRLLALLLCPIAVFPQAVIFSQGGPDPARPTAGAPKPVAPTYKPDELCTVEGLVRNAVTGEPLNKARITLLAMEPQSSGSQATTSSNSEGKFSLKAIEPGRYRMAVDRAGFVRTEYGARPGAMMGGTTLTLGKGQAMGNIELRLSPHSVITGRVLDEDGEPVQSAQVQVLRYSFLQGRKQLMPINGASTNDLGEYRAFGIPPGKYFISVTTRNTAFANAVDRSANPQPDEGYAPTYYPGTPDIAAATQVNVALGRTVQGIDATLRKTRTYRIKGRVAGVARAGNRGGMVSVRSKDPAATMYSFDRNMSNWRGPNGEFELRGVRPGSYVVEAMHSEAPDQVLTGRASVEVTDRDIEGVTLTLAPGVEVRGSIRVDGQGALDFANVNVFLQPKVMGMMMMGNTMARPNDEGAFSIPRVTPDSFYVRVTGTPPEFYLKSVRLGDTDVLEHGLDLEKAGSASGLDVVFSPGAATVEGSVADEKGNPAKGCALLLRPNDTRASMLTLLQKYVTSDQNGHFKITGITPGTYHLIAFEGLDLMEVQDPDLFQQHETKAIKIELQQNAVESRTLKAIALEQKTQ